MSCHRNELCPLAPAHIQTSPYRIIPAPHPQQQQHPTASINYTAYQQLPWISPREKTTRSMPTATTSSMEPPQTSPSPLMALIGISYVHSSNIPMLKLTSIQAVCAVMFVSTVAFAGLSFTKPRSHRIFHYITAAITMVAAIAYFTMGADLGETGIKPEFIRTNSKVAGNLREIFYVRYIDWYV